MRIIVACVLVVDASRRLHSHLNHKDASRSETNPLTRLLLALGNLGPLRFTNRDDNWHIVTRRTVRADSRKSKLVASVGNGVSEATRVRWRNIDEQGFFNLSMSHTSTEGVDVETIPLLPLSGSAYVPYTSEVLSIFEPRYRAMYNDVIFSGARRFAVCTTNDDGQIMDTAVVFYLNDLREVSEQSGDRLKYIGEHTVVGRVKLLRVLNPSVAKTEETYLRAEVEDLVDTDVDVDTSAAELEVKQLFKDFVELQYRLGEEVRFSDQLPDTLSFDRSLKQTDSNIGLWAAVALWKQFLDARVQQASSKARAEMKEALRELELKQSAELETERSKRAKLSDEISRIILGSKEGLKVSDSLPSNDFMLALIQSPSHSDRLSIFKKMVENHYNRLRAMESLKLMFNR